MESSSQSNKEALQLPTSERVICPESDSREVQRSRTSQLLTGAIGTRLPRRDADQQKAGTMRKRNRRRWHGLGALERKYQPF